MKVITVFLFLFSTFIFSQNSSVLNFEDLKQKMEFNAIDINDLGKNDENKLTETELKVIHLLNNDTENLNQKDITFITGSTGKSISNKKYFFDSFRNHYLINDLISFSIVKLDDKSRLLSGTDYIIYYWVKMYNPKSRTLLKKIKQTKQIE
jgi:hypothetical protein